MFLKILMPIPTTDFDPTEVSIPWKQLTAQGFQVYFATPDGTVAQGDQRMVYGTNLGVFKSLLMARADAVLAYEELLIDPRFNRPMRYSEIKVIEFDGLILPGGHASGMKSYLESTVLQKKVGEFFTRKQPVGAICHGTVLLARTLDPKTGYSVIREYQTTGLLKKQELMAYYLTRFWLKSYYRTYPITVEDEVKSVLASASHFKQGNSGVLRDSPQQLKRGFVVRDRNYLSARWPGDVYRFTAAFIELMQEVDT